MKTSPVEAEFHADGRTDMTKLIVAFRSFENAPKKEYDSDRNMNVKEEIQNVRQCHSVNFC
jgi:hypothetical protein